MQIEIKITNPSAEFLAALMLTHASRNAGVVQEAFGHVAQGAEPEAAPVKDEAVPEAREHQPITEGTRERICTAEDVESLEVDDLVHWKGQKFEFYGTVEDIDTYNADTDTKVLWLRRLEDHKKVSLTLGDIERGCLTRA